MKRGMTLMSLVPLTLMCHREALWDAITVHVVSSDPSRSEEDGAKQLSNMLSNLKAITTVEEETLRY